MRTEHEAASFEERAEALRKEGKLSEAMEVCLDGLSRNEGSHKGRLILARVYYQKGYLPFALKELCQLASSVTENEGIKNLINKISPGFILPGPSKTAESAAEKEDSSMREQTLAEAEIELDDLDFGEDEN